MLHASEGYRDDVTVVPDYNVLSLARWVGRLPKRVFPFFLFAFQCDQKLPKQPGITPACTIGIL